ncbi:hypothetical protein D3C71_920890 [compost metagenome]
MHANSATLGDDGHSWSILWFQAWRQVQLHHRDVEVVDIVEEADGVGAQQPHATPRCGVCNFLLLLASLFAHLGKT